MTSVKLTRLTFTSYRDTKGYQIVGEVPPPRRTQRKLHPLWQRVLSPSVVQEISDALDAQRRDELGLSLGFERNEVPAERLDDGGEWLSGHIVGLGGKKQAILLEQYPNAFEKFASLQTKGELLNFIAKFGPLTNEKHQAVLRLLYEAEQMRECTQDDRFLYNRDLNLTVSLSKKRKMGELETLMTPSSLLDALWLQFQHSKSSGAEFRTCPFCKEIFAAGGSSGRLRNAEFCSPEHRKRFNSLARSNPKMRKMRGRHK